LAAKLGSCEVYVHIDVINMQDMDCWFQ